MANWDVIVLGLGGVGSAAAYHLAAAGHRVLGLDQYFAAHKHGSSHGRCRIIRQAYFEHPSYVPLLRRAYELWFELEQAVGQRLFERTGLVEIGPPDGIVIPGIIAAAEQFNLDVERLSCKEVTKRWPGIRAKSDWEAIIEQNAGFLRVESCILAHLKRATDHGAKLIHGQPVLDWTSDGSQVSVTTANEIHRADRLVIAAGPWSQQALAGLGIEFQVLRKHQYWFEATKDCELDRGFPCFFHETDQGYFYGFPGFDQSGVKVARHSGGRIIDAPGDSKPGDSDPMDQQLVENYIGKYIPGVSRKLLSHADCYYTMTEDEHFAVGTHPQYQQVVFVAGLSGHGFKFTSVLGEIACQLAVEGKSARLPEFFAIERLLRGTS